jgi:hypothetical protein
MVRSFAAVLLFVLGIGCGGAEPQTRIPFDPCSMPPEGNWTGEWNSPQFGIMQVSQSGQSVVGQWNNDVTHRVGRLEGTMQGCLVLFTWNESDNTVPGMPRQFSGRGVFRYIYEPPSGAAADAHRFEGTWGYGNEVQGGGAWEGRRRRL